MLLTIFSLSRSLLFVCFVLFLFAINISSCVQPFIWFFFYHCFCLLPFVSCQPKKETLKPLPSLGVGLSKRLEGDGPIQWAFRWDCLRSPCWGTSTYEVVSLNNPQGWYYNETPYLRHAVQWYMNSLGLNKTCQFTLIRNCLSL